MRWDDIDKQVCSVARALSIVGERWTMLIIRDAFLGTRRFDQFQSNLGITRHRLSERLTKLVEQGVLVKVPYQERPLRYEYRLTRKGLGLYPVLMSLARWGDEWMDHGEGVPLEYVHLKCGKKTRPVLTCRTSMTRWGESPIFEARMTASEVAAIVVAERKLLIAFRVWPDPIFPR